MKHGIHVALEINGTGREFDVPLTETLLSSLRERLGLTGTKRGCNQGVCGACTVTLDGLPVRACLSLTANCEGQSVRTIEGLGEDRATAELQRTFVEHGALQCGFCTPGQIIAARALLEGIPRPSIEEVQSEMSGNLCRCTGYRKIIDAVRIASERLQS